MGHLQGFNLVMSKCHVRELSNLYKAIFKDALVRYPTLGTDFEKDLTRLLGLVEHRGIQVFLVDLPALGKHFDRCLSNGEYKLSNLPLSKRYSGRVVIPKFLRGLYLLVFDETGCLKDDYDVEAILFIRQILFAAKKASVPCSPEKVEDEVLNFFEVDSGLPEPEGFWSAEYVTVANVEEEYHGYEFSALLQSRLRASCTSNRTKLSVVLATLDSVSSIVSTALGSYDPGDWSFKHGPGAVSEVTGPSNKYSWKNWSNRLEREFPIADYGFHSYASWADRCHTDEYIGSKEPYSRMVAVPKSYSGPRLIAAEPSEHQWCQQNLLHYFVRRCEDSFINSFVRFDDQTINQNLCKLGSGDGTLATVDLSAASDRVTCHVVGQFFRSNPNLLLALQSSRTRGVDQKLTRRAPASIPLRKFSTMGSACTFPVESLIFVSIALSCVLVTRGLRPTKRNIEALRGEVAVYGDDIVIPVDSRELFVEALELLYFKVNAAKSFWTGKFRESCGVDSFDGVNVTPVYWKRPYDGKAESLASVLDTRNNFYQKFFLNVASYLASTLPTGMIPKVDQRSGAFGLKTRCSTLDNQHLRCRYNNDLQRLEVLAITCLTRNDRTAIEGDSALLQFFTEKPEPHIMWKSGVSQRSSPKTRKRWVSIEDLVT